MTTARWSLGLVGVAAGLYGSWLLLSRQSGDQLVSAAGWLVGGVVLHDFVLAPVVLVAVAVAGRLAPRPVRAPAAVLLVVIGSVTLVAVPVLGAFGRRADNASLLDRDYWTGWLVLVGVLVVLVAVGSLVQRWRRGDGADPGR
jgi:membrane protease YdiL (CAAX protease family)